VTYRYPRAEVAACFVLGIRRYMLVDYRRDGSGPTLGWGGGPSWHAYLVPYPIAETFADLGIEWIESEARCVNPAVAEAALTRLVTEAITREKLAKEAARLKEDARVAAERAEFLRQLTEIRARWLVDKRLSLEDLAVLLGHAEDDYEMGR
jgi:hypothetical protein